MTRPEKPGVSERFGQLFPRFWLPRAPGGLTLIGVITPVTFVHRFAGTDPWENLAREETWLEALAPGESALLLYVNAPCIVLGKHQNPLREVRLDEAAARGLPLVRRSSGGGTVYHDEGNLNWSFLGPKEGYDRALVSARVVQALGTLGRDLEVGERGDLFLGEKKVTGAAYLFRRDRVVHHGTLLCQARLDALRGVLGPTGVLTEWVGVASRPMPVTNLDLGVDVAAAALAATWGPGLAVGQGSGDVGFEARVADRRRELATGAWLWGTTPAFTWEGETRLGWLRARVGEGVIEAAWDDRNLNMSNMVGKWFFDPELFPYLSREVV